MDLEDVRAVASRSTEASFIEAHPHWYLALGALADTGSFSFATVIGRLPSAADPSPEIAIVPLAKAAGNPYADRIAIGRARNCDVVLHDPSVSKLHAHIRIANGVRALVDLGSHNGTTVDGSRLEQGVPRAITPGVRVAFGLVHARVIDAAILFRLLREPGRAAFR